MTASGATVKLTWRAERPALEGAAMRLSEILVPPADAVSLEKFDPTEDDAESGWALYAYFETAPDPDAIAVVLDDLAIDEPETEDLAPRDWVAEALEGLGIVEAGDFLLFGSHDADKIGDRSGHRLQIEANRAFGTGHHPTTAGCLQALTAIRDMHPAKVLDVGTGSGVLSLAARRLWTDANILGTDIDADSVAIAVENAVVNGVDDLHFQRAEGIPPQVAAEGPFDLILANILAEPLIGLAPDVADTLTPGGKVILAGLLARQEDAVTEAYAAKGLRVTDRTGDPVWPVLTLSVS